MRFHVIAVGRVRAPGLRASCDEYLTRVRRTMTVTVREVPEAGRAAETPALARRREETRLRKALPDGATVVALARSGRAVSSAQFARQVERWRVAARDVAFVIGGAYGLAQPLIKDATMALSLSSMTLPHELARVVLLEQLYRAGTMLRGEPYHKGGDE
jgi:23S rRNA (pseudouridine1915-N3)-methyltransferase